ncbi:DUF4431 domain-containing protein [Acinetobacter sp. ANC 5383]
MKKLGSFLIGTLLPFTIHTASAETLQGKLVSLTATDPDVVSVTNHGKPVKYKALQLSSPRSLNIQDEVGEPKQVKHVNNIQLAASPQMLKNIALNSTVKVDCDLFGSHTIYHYTEVLCNVERIQKIK